MNINQPFKALGLIVAGIARFISTEAILLPTGTTAQRPSTENGLIRYNTTTARVEKCENGVWTSILASSDIQAIVQAYNNLSLTSPTISNATISSPLISAAAIGSSTWSGGTISTPTINNGTIAGSTITGATITNPSTADFELLDAPTTTWDMNQSHVAKWVVAPLVNRTLAAPTNLKPGGQYVLLLGINSPATTVITWPANIIWPYGVPPDTTTTAWTVISMVWSPAHGKLLATYSPGF